jgi:hypothetical protein
MKHLMALPKSAVFQFQRMPCMQVLYHMRHWIVHQQRLQQRLQLRSLAQKGPTVLPVKLIAQVALLGIQHLQQVQSELQQQHAICARLDISVMLLSLVAVDALCVLQANLPIIAARLNVRSAGKGHMLLKVRRSASLAMQANTPEKRLLHACHARQDMQGCTQGHRAIVARLAHGVLKARARVQCVRQARSAPLLEQNLSSAAPARIQTRGNLPVERVSVASIAPLAQLLVLHARKAKHRLTELPLANHAAAVEVRHAVTKPMIFTNIGNVITIAPYK